MAAGWIKLGQVEVPADKINERQLTEAKFPITSSVVGRIGKDASLRMKARYQRIEILPITFYQPLLEVGRVHLISSHDFFSSRLK